MASRKYAMAEETVRTALLGIRTAHWDGSVPVDVEGILHSMQADVMAADIDMLGRWSPDEKRARGEVIGSVVLEGDRACFLCDAGIGADGRRLLLARMLGHCLADPYVRGLRFHIEREPDRAKGTPVEALADLFAEGLLMPESAVRGRHGAMRALRGIAPSSGELAAAFGVDVSMMERRLEELGLPYRPEGGADDLP